MSANLLHAKTCAPMRIMRIMSTMHESVAVLDTAQAAVALRVSRSTVTRLVKAGTLAPLHKSPGRTSAFTFTVEEVARVREERSK